MTEQEVAFVPDTTVDIAAGIEKAKADIAAGELSPPSLRDQKAR